MSADLPIQMLPARKGVKKGTPSPRKGTGVDWVNILIRLRPETAKHLRASAVANLRSRGAECRFRLEGSVANESIDEHGVIVVRSRAAHK